MIHRLMERERRRVKCLNAPTLRKHFLKNPKLHYLLRHHPEGREWREGREGGAGLPKKASRETVSSRYELCGHLLFFLPNFPRSEHRGIRNNIRAVLPSLLNLFTTLHLM